MTIRRPSVCSKGFVSTIRWTVFGSALIVIEAVASLSGRKVGSFMWAWDPINGYNRTRELTSDVGAAMASKPEIHDFLSVMLGGLDVQFNGEFNESIFVPNPSLIQINQPIFQNRSNTTEIYLPIEQIPTIITSPGRPFGHKPRDWFVIDPRDPRFNLDRFMAGFVPFARALGLSGIVLDDESFCAPRVLADEVALWFQYVDLLGARLHAHGLRLKAFIVCASCMRINGTLARMRNSSVDTWISMDTYSADFDFWKANVDYYRPLGPKFSPGLYPAALAPPHAQLPRDVLALYASYLLVAAPAVTEVWLFCYPWAYRNPHLSAAMAAWRDSEPEGPAPGRRPDSDAIRAPRVASESCRAVAVVRGGTGAGGLRAD